MPKHLYTAAKTTIKHYRLHLLPSPQSVSPSANADEQQELTQDADGRRLHALLQMLLNAHVLVH